MYSKQDHFKNIVKKKSVNNRTAIIGELYCPLTRVTYTTIRGLMNAIRPFGYTPQQYYDKFYAMENEGYCLYDNTYRTKFINIVEGYRSICGKCEQCKLNTRKKQSDSARQQETIQAKLVGLAKWREKNPGAASESAYRGYLTRCEKYGHDYHSIRTREQWKNYTDEEKAEILTKIDKTKTINGTHTGGEHFRQTGKFVEIDGEKHFVQGYEDAVLKALYSFGLKPKTGKNKKRLKCSNNKSGLSNIDIYIDELNLFIEVKSSYTFETNFDKMRNITLENEEMFVVFVPSSVNKDRLLFDDDINDFAEFLNMAISSQADDFYRKVQRLSRDREYAPIAIGGGSARVPSSNYITLDDIRNVI